MLSKYLLHDYQCRLVDMIKREKSMLIAAGVGVGKTITSLTAFKELYDEFEVHKCLVVAPKMVSLTTWHREIENWEHLRDLRYSIVTGTKAYREKALQKEADVYIINYDALLWLWSDWFKKKHDRIPYDMFIFDESHFLKTYSAKRTRAAILLSKNADYKVLLTATPTPAGYQDLFSQMLIIDGGERLGSKLGEFRSRYMYQTPFHAWELYKWAIPKIKEKVRDKIVHLKAEDYNELPALNKQTIRLDMPKKARKVYDKLLHDLVVEIEESGDVITAVSAGVLFTKLLQISSGMSYTTSGELAELHTVKVDMLKEIVESTDDNIFVVYAFKHEIDRIKRALKGIADVGVAGEGDATERFMRGDLRVLLGHPKSVGAGLNFQHASHTVVWFTGTTSPTDYEQTNGRVYRQGQKERVNIIHLTCGDIEYRMMRMLAQKTVTQEELLRAAIHLD